MNVMSGITHAESSLLWRVKAMLVLKEYESAETLLTDKVEEYRRIGLAALFRSVVFAIRRIVQVNKREL